jgi:hypothetical protein
VGRELATEAQPATGVTKHVPPALGVGGRFQAGCRKQPIVHMGMHETQQVELLACRCIKESMQECGSAGISTAKAVSYPAAACMLQQ